MKFTKGFTLIELLVVISIIGVLATIVLTSLGEAREKSQNTKRLALVKQMQTGLEMYYLDNNEYPRTTSGFGVNANNYGANASNAEALQFEADLAPYITIDISDEDIFKGDDDYWGDFNYQTSPGNNYQTYGMLLYLRGDYVELSENDGGYYPSSTHSGIHYEVGESPKYCMEKYTGTGRNWVSTTNVCVGGN